MKKYLKYAFLSSCVLLIASPEHSAWAQAAGNQDSSAKKPTAAGFKQDPAYETQASQSLNVKATPNSTKPGAATTNTNAGTAKANTSIPVTQEKAESNPASSAASHDKH